MIRVNMSKQDIYWIYRVYSMIRVNMSKQHYYTRVHRVYSMTRVNMSKQDIQGYTRYTV